MRITPACLSLLLACVPAVAQTTKGIIDPDCAKRPDDAIELVGDKGYDLVTDGVGAPQWSFKDGVLTASPKWDSLLTKEAFEDFRLHVEFNVNSNPNAKNREGDGNSGIYIQQRYEIQIQNAHGIPADEFTASYGGSIYKMKKPDHLVSKRAGEWQTYDIVFRAARFEGDKKIENARLTVYHNDVLIHDDFELPRKTGAGKKEGPEPLPTKFQGHHNQVRFRNIWLQKLSLENGKPTKEKG